jgi:hypothetical protein
MTTLLIIPAAAIVLALLWQPSKTERIGYVERIPKGARPLPSPTRRQRLQRWAALYGRCTIEQQLAPGEWPFVASAVHELPKAQQTDPRELVR